MWASGDGWVGRREGVSKRKVEEEKGVGLREEGGGREGRERSRTQRKKKVLTECLILSIGCSTFRR